MHFNFDFTAVQVLWTLTFAAHLVLLVVLMGRERIRRFPWFTASIVVTTLHALTAELLSGRMATLPLNSILITLFDLEAIAAVLVAIELARRAFGKARRLYWAIGLLASVSVAIAVVAFWGLWPSWARLTADRSIAVLLLLRLASQKISLLANVLTVEVSLLVVWLGRRFRAGWRSHTQQILIGLSTASITQLVLVGIFQSMAPPHTRDEYNHLVALQDKIFNANNAVYVAVLIWWIACLWMDEPAQAVGTAEAVEVQGLVGAVAEPTLEVAEAPQIQQPEAVAPVNGETSEEVAVPIKAEKMEEVPAEMPASSSKPRKARKSPSVKVPAKPKEAKKTDAKTASAPAKAKKYTANASPAPVKAKKPKTASIKTPATKPEFGKPADN